MADKTMTQDHPVVKALALIKAGDKAFDARDHRRALSCFEEAMSLGQQVPAGEWDQNGFLAMCSACLSGPLGALERPKEALEQADRALAFFDRHGQMYPAEFGRWVMATFNRGAALAQLGRAQEALAFIRKAKSMLPAGTVLTLNLSARLRRSLATTNAAESLLIRTRHVKRNVKRWRSGQMMLRWVAAGVLEAVKGFRRVKGYADMPMLVAALRTRDRQLGLTAAQEERQIA